MDIARFSERLMGMKDEIWLRHANPWSVWTRVLTPLPLLALAIWSREWIDNWAWVAVGAVLVWVWVNPRAFSQPETFDSWSAQGVLGERVWLRNRDKIAVHHKRVANALAFASGTGLLPFAYGLWAFDLGFTCLGIVVISGGKMWFVDRMGWVWSDFLRDGGSMDDLKSRS
ncbi:DUF6653 family protein [Ruegeria atlantica]|uniref:Uncharacterized protein n=1 Tax=Ruegeria atlantica TaxID=81569 RepID=A0A0P1E3D7_9RHOB|nr:DUF6653 family protein [Ruegeria atlantica]CUH42889.1 hypothetical protein RUM4293_01778 [Ruegeria atlantica]